MIAIMIIGALFLLIIINIATSRPRRPYHPGSFYPYGAPPYEDDYWSYRINRQMSGLINGILFALLLFAGILLMNYFANPDQEQVNDRMEVQDDYFQRADY